MAAPPHIHHAVFEQNMPAVISKQSESCAHVWSKLAGSMSLQAPPSGRAPLSTLASPVLQMPVFTAGVQAPWVHSTAGQSIVHALHVGSRQ
jgi:hypothetical protein